LAHERSHDRSICDLITIITTVQLLSSL
jgi:hypothetical protein